MRGMTRLLAMTPLLLAACIYRLDQLPIALGEGDVTGVLRGVPPGTIIEAALNGARVMLRGSALVRSSGPDGRFVLRNLPEGTHTLVLTYDGTLDGVPDLIRRLEVPIRIPPGQAGGKRSAVDLGTVNLLPAGIIEGRVEFEGTPQAFTHVRVAVAGQDVLVPVGDDGRFRVPGLAHGAWDVVAAAPGFISEPTSADIASGETTTLSAPLILRATGGLTPGSVQGEVVDPPERTPTSGVGIVRQGLGASVTLRLVQPATGATVFEESVSRSFVRSNVEPGVYAVLLQPGGDCRDIVVAGVVVQPGDPAQLGRLLASKVQSTATAECEDQDGDGLCFIGAGDDDCRARCSVDTLHQGCGNSGKLDCDDDGDGQPDVEEDPAARCACGLGPMDPAAACLGDPLRADRDSDGVCDAVDPYPLCASNTDPCGGSGSSSGGGPSSSSVGTTSSTGGISSSSIPSSSAAPGSSSSASSGGTSSSGGTASTSMFPPSSGVMTASSTSSSSGTPSSTMTGITSSSTSSSSSGGANPSSSRGTGTSSSSSGGAPADVWIAAGPTTGALAPFDLFLKGAVPMADGGVVMVGTTSTSVALDGVCPDLTVTPGQSTAVVIRYDNTLQCQWAQTINGSDGARAFAVALDESGQLVVAGTVGGDLQVGTSTPLPGMAGLWQAFVVKLSALDGNDTTVGRMLGLDAEFIDGGLQVLTPSIMPPTGNPVLLVQRYEGNAPITMGGPESVDLTSSFGTKTVVSVLSGDLGMVNTFHVVTSAFGAIPTAVSTDAAGNWSVLMQYTNDAALLAPTMMGGTTIATLMDPLMASRPMVGEVHGDAQSPSAGVDPVGLDVRALEGTSAIQLDNLTVGAGPIASGCMSGELRLTTNGPVRSAVSGPAALFVGHDAQGMPQWSSLLHTDLYRAPSPSMACPRTTGSATGQLAMFGPLRKKVLYRNNADETLVISAPTTDPMWPNLVALRLDPNNGGLIDATVHEPLADPQDPFVASSVDFTNSVTLADGSMLVWGAMRGGVRFGHQVTCSGLDSSLTTDLFSQPEGGVYFWRLPAPPPVPPPGSLATCNLPAPPSDSGDVGPMSDASPSLTLGTPVTTTLGVGDEDCFQFNVTTTANSLIMETSATDMSCSVDTVLQWYVRSVSGDWYANLGEDDPQGIASPCASLTTVPTETGVAGICVRGYAGAPVGDVRVTVSFSTN